VGRSEVADIGGPESRSGVAFAVGTTALLLGVVAGVVGLLIVPALLAYVVTPVVTGWRDPGPDIIQGCEKSLICSEPGPFFTVWLASRGVRRGGGGGPPSCPQPACAKLSSSAWLKRALVSRRT
jgi:hypothetical protein